MNKHDEYLKVVMNARTSSTSNSSTTFGGCPTIEPIDQLFHKIREKVFDIDLIQLVENNTSSCHGIKELLR